MIGKESIQKISEHFRKRSGGSLDTQWINPAREWLLALSMSILLFVTMAVYAGYTYIVQTRKLEEVPSVEPTVVRYDREKAQEVRTYFERRSEAFEAYRTERGHVRPLPVDTQSESEAEPVAGEERAQ